MIATYGPVRPGWGVLVPWTAIMELRSRRAEPSPSSAEQVEGQGARAVPGPDDDEVERFEHDVEAERGRPRPAAGRGGGPLQDVRAAEGVPWAGRDVEGRSAGAPIGDQAGCDAGKGVSWGHE